jgi:hypothetical protein
LKSEESFTTVTRGLWHMRVCNRCRKETEAIFCPTCHVLTYPPKAPDTSPTTVSGESFEATIWQGPNRSRGIEVPTIARDRFFLKHSEEVVLHIEGKRTVVKLGAGFWKKPAVIKRALTDDGRDQLIKFFEKHHLLPPQQSLKEKGIVDTIIFEVITPKEEFKISTVERKEAKDDQDEQD